MSTDTLDTLPMHLRPGAKQRRVVCAAMRLNRKPHHVIASPRHWDQFANAQVKLSHYNWRAAEQGFIDQFGQFMTRPEAYQVALAAGQILYGPHLGHCEPPELDSSDLY